MSASPYLDWEDLHLKEGDAVGFKDRNGELLWGRITSIDENEETGEIRITAE